METIILTSNYRFSKKEIASPLIFAKEIYRGDLDAIIDVQKIEYSFEVDMLFTDLQLPLHLVSYRSSLISWIKMLCPQVKTHIIDEIV